MNWRNLILRVVSFVIPLKIKRFIINSESYVARTYSQEAEDLILDIYFEGKVDGFFVDVGAFHPQKYSNTYNFYKKGWTGINVDATPGSMTLFNQIRPKDINLECGVSKDSGTITFYEFNKPALNTFVKENAEFRNNRKDYKIINETLVNVYPLHEILHKHLPKSQTIDLLTIDVEGHDLAVLESNNWHEYVPEFILIEDTESSLESYSKSKIWQFLNSKGYELIAKTVRTWYFKKR